MLLSLFAGAVADSYDRRKIALVAALGIALFGATGLSIVTAFGLLTPAWIFFFCFVVGTGMALFGPAWQSSVGEQVPARELPVAIALNSISYNIARSFGPAIGGFLGRRRRGRVGGLRLQCAGLSAADRGDVFLAAIARAVAIAPRSAGPRRHLAGARYVLHSPPVRAVLIRTLLTARWSAHRSRRSCR